MITQSLAIIEWLEETLPVPALLPPTAAARARVRAFALVLAADTHPLQNLGVLARMRDLGLDQAAVQGWGAAANETGLGACEALLAEDRFGIAAGPFCFGGAPSLADICLVPQLGNARRFGVNVARYRRLLVAEAACLRLEAFASAAPERQADAQ